MAFTSPLSYVMQLLHSLVLTHHLLHPSLALRLCFRRLPSESQVRACNPELLQATVLPSRHRLARVWIIPSANHRSHLLHGPYLLLHSPPSGVWLVPPFWTVLLHCFLHYIMEGGDLSWQELLLNWSRLIHSTCFFLLICRDASPPLACEGDLSASLLCFDDLFCVITAKRSWLCF